MSQPAYHGSKAEGGGSYSVDNCYHGPPVPSNENRVGKDATGNFYDKKGKLKSSKMMVNLPTAQPDAANDPRDMTEQGVATWIGAGENIIPIHFDPISRTIQRGHGSYASGPMRPLNDGKKFTYTGLFISGGNYKGDINHAGIALVMPANDNDAGRGNSSHKKHHDLEQIVSNDDHHQHSASGHH